MSPSVRGVDCFRELFTRENTFSKRRGRKRRRRRRRRSRGFEPKDVFRVTLSCFNCFFRSGFWRTVP